MRAARRGVCLRLLIGKTEKEHHKAGADLRSRSLFASPAASHAHSGGRQSVDHPKGDHDDFANACCGVLRELSTYLGYDYTYRAFQPGFVDEDVVQPQPAAQPEPSAAQFVGTADWLALQMQEAQLAQQFGMIGQPH